MTAPEIESSSSCCNSSSGCCGVPSPEKNAGISRRQFLTRTGAASVALLLSGLPRWAAGSGEVRMSEHLIPKNKELPPGWLRSLKERGDPERWSGRALRTVGMPVGGIGAGQIYLCGDGTLGQWEIFNEYHVPGHGLTSYVRRSIPKPVRHGIALTWKADGQTNAKLLDESGFAEVAFRNTHPIGTVSYADPDCPLKVTLEGFSPFIPLNAKDSALPATIMVVTVENNGESDVEVGTASWLENPIGRKAHTNWYKGIRKNQVFSGDGQGRIVMSAREVESERTQTPREPIVFADFEGRDFGQWKTEGTAFGDAPTTGNLPTQQNVEGWEGNGFAGSFRKRDDSQGKLVSPSFTVNRQFVNYKIGGGNKAGVEGIILVVDGKPVRTGTGRDNERMEWQSWDISEFEGQQAHLEIVDQSRDGWGHTQVDSIEFADERRIGDGPSAFDEFPDVGTLAWGVMEPLAEPADADVYFKALGSQGQDVLTEPAPPEYALTESRTSGIATRMVTLKPGEKKTFSHVLTWHFPNTVEPDRKAGHYYASLFKDAGAVLDYVTENHDRLVNDTRKWRDTWHDSTLPHWLLDRIHMTSCCLATGTTMWWENGRYWAFEGVTCCVGTCTHVYNYVQTVARLFPELERNTRERQDLKLGVGLEPSGLVGFRHDGKYAADGQCGTVLKVYREHQMSADDSFLKRNWPHTKMVLDYAIGQDANADGIMEGSQHNTYDADLFGPNTFVGALYLAALRAGEEMAREMGEHDYADKCHQIYEKGRKFSEDKLWNGEYFYQQVNLAAHDHFQYGKGCLSDQLFGQNWAHQLNLGYIYDPEKARKALESIWSYNWAPDLGPYNEQFPAQRIFAEEAEAGLFNCTWPHSEHLDDGILYRDEVWSGVEYQVASHMIYEGLSTEGLALCRAVHDRYNPHRRNPFNEIECSDYYSRAMASWGMLLALSGYNYHGPKGHMEFNPRISPENFKCAFNAAEGWGSFEQKISPAGRQFLILLKHGSLTLTDLVLPYNEKARGIIVDVDEKVLSGVQTEVIHAGKVRLKFQAPVQLTAGQAIKVLQQNQFQQEAT